MPLSLLPVPARTYHPTLVLVPAGTTVVWQAEVVQVLVLQYHCFYGDLEKNDVTQWGKTLKRSVADLVVFICLLDESDPDTANMLIISTFGSFFK